MDDDESEGREKHMSGITYGDTLRVATDALTVERDEFYGDPYDTYGHAARIASAKLGRAISPTDVIWILTSVKEARELKRHKPDNLVDLSAYADILNYIMERGV